MEAQKNNFGPEIGFAWSPTKFNDRLVLRGGYGLNYNQEEIAISANIAANPGLSIGQYLTLPSPTSPKISALSMAFQRIHTASSGMRRTLTLS